MAMRRCLMKLQITGLRARSNFTGGLLSKQLPHRHHPLKLHGIRSLFDGPQGSSWLNPNSKSGSPQEHPPSSMESEIEKLRVEMKMMHSELLRHISESTKSSASQRKEERPMRSTKIEVINNYAEIISKLVPATMDAVLIVIIIALASMVVAAVVALITYGSHRKKDIYIPSQTEPAGLK